MAMRVVFVRRPDLMLRSMCSQFSRVPAEALVVFGDCGNLSSNVRIGSEGFCGMCNMVGRGWVARLGIGRGRIFPDAAKYIVRDACACKHLVRARKSADEGVGRVFVFMLVCGSA